MVGEGTEADAATSEFCAYWEDNAALSGGVLVYNTGRSLGQFMGLWQSKKGALSLPDVLITAVGTKVGCVPCHCHLCPFLCGGDCMHGDCVFCKW